MQTEEHAYFGFELNNKSELHSVEQLKITFACDVCFVWLVFFFFFLTVIHLCVFICFQLFCSSQIKSFNSFFLLFFFLSAVALSADYDLNRIEIQWEVRRKESGSWMIMSSVLADGQSTCLHLQQFKQQRNGLQLYKLVYSSLVVVLNEESRKRKVNFTFCFDLELFLFQFQFLSFSLSSSSGTEYDVLYLRWVLCATSCLSRMHLPWLF